MPPPCLERKLHICICSICSICTRQLNPSRDGVGGCVLRCTFADRPSMIALTSAAWRSSTGAASARYRRSICNFFSAHTSSSWYRSAGIACERASYAANMAPVRSAVAASARANAGISDFAFASAMMTEFNTWPRSSALDVPTLSSTLPTRRVNCETKCLLRFAMASATSYPLLSPPPPAPPPYTLAKPFDMKPAALCWISSTASSDAWP
mmetsp:Transcript_13319/g.32404  ORF Transcript_13319/g.32404 Transcript_13319/m.32404 type:complete len:210 (-) Transcript_13319:392-1021(-)